MRAALPAKYLRRPLLAASLLVFLGACGQGGGLGGGILAGMSRAKAPATARLASGRIIVAGPPGFCVQKSSRVTTRGSGFIALGQCASISGNPEDATVSNPALLSVSVTALSDPAQATPEVLAQYFTSGGGRDGVKSTEIEGDVLIIRARDTSPRRPTDLNNAYWRAMFTRKGYLISLNVSSLAETPISEATGRRLLADFIKAMQQANPRDEKDANGVVSLLNRLL